MSPLEDIPMTLVWVAMIGCFIMGVVLITVGVLEDNANFHTQLREGKVEALKYVKGEITKEEYLKHREV